MRIVSNLLVAILLLSAPDLEAITLAGSNGKAVEFYSIESATPKGLTARIVDGGPILGITWDKLDLGALEREQKAIYDAYLRAIQGETVALKIEKPPMGTSGDPPTSPDGKPGAPPESRYPGWLDLKIGPISFMMQLPGNEPRGILIVSVGDLGRSFERFYTHQRGSGVWGAFQTQFDLAVLTYQVDADKFSPDPTVIGDFVYAEKSSGKVFEAAIKDFAVKTKKPKLADLPIALYGADRSGAAFVYNYVHYRPERVLAAVVSKGAFYDAAPTPEASKVPMLFIWGQYSNSHEIWASENHAVPVLAKAAPLNPNWTNGKEFRGRDEQNEVVEYFGKKYLLDLIATRLPEKSKPVPPPAAPATGETAAPDGEKKPEAPAPPVAEAPKIVELDRTKGFRGNLVTGEVLSITDPAAPLGEDETFIPSESVGKMWKAFIIGELEPPARTPLQ